MKVVVERERERESEMGYPDVIMMAERHSRHRDTSHLRHGILHLIAGGFQEMSSNPSKRNLLIWINEGSFPEKKKWGDRIS